MKGPGWRFSQLDTLTGNLFRMSHAEWPFLWWLIIDEDSTFNEIYSTFIVTYMTFGKPFCKNVWKSQIGSSLNWTVFGRSERSMKGQLKKAIWTTESGHVSARPSALSRVTVCFDLLVLYYLFTCTYKL